MRGNPRQVCLQPEFWSLVEWLVEIYLLNTSSILFQIIQDVSQILLDICSSSVGQAEVLTRSRKEMWDRFDFISKQLELITLSMKEQIRFGKLKTALCNPNIFTPLTIGLESLPLATATK